jgi:hypothetical protein
MSKSQKSQLTCSYCSKIFKDPILLPCDDSMCRVHLSQRDVLKQNKIKCTKCREKFQVKENEFKSNEDLKKLVEDQTHLSEGEVNLKQKLEDSIRFEHSLNSTTNTSKIKIKSNRTYSSIFKRCAFKWMSNAKN